MTAAIFDRALALVLEREGGFVNHPLDPGGATNRGITRATLARVRGRPVSVAEIMALSEAEAAAIYRARYWEAVAGDALPDGIAIAVFDSAVNSGPGRAARLLQRALGVRDDGIIGPMTVAAARGSDEAATIRTFTQLRLGFLGRLPTWPIFGRGWRRRVEAIEKAALAVAARGSAAPPAAPASPPAMPAGHGIPSPASKTLQPESKEPSMIDTKSILASRTIWANIVGLASVGLSAFGFKTAGIDTGGIADAILQVVTGTSLVASTVFRVVASKRIGA